MQESVATPRGGDFKTPNFFEHLIMISIIKTEVRKRILNSDCSQNFKEFVLLHSQDQITAHLPFKDDYVDVYSGKNVLEFND